MKNYFPKYIFILFFTLLITSCSNENDEVLNENLTDINLNYSDIENEIIYLINNHRENIGLSRLNLLNIISSEAIIHSEYMISECEISHDNFSSRCETLINNTNAINVSENLAYGYSSAESVVNSWIASPSHKLILEKNNITDFGISVKKDCNNRNYFTNIFIER